MVLPEDRLENPVPETVIAWPELYGPAGAVGAVTVPVAPAPNARPGTNMRPAAPHSTTAPMIWNRSQAFLRLLGASMRVITARRFPRFDCPLDARMPEDTGD